MNDIKSTAEQIAGDAVKGLVQLEDYKGCSVPLEQWDIVSPMDDIILAEYVDTPDGENIDRNGILLPKSMIEHSWRICKVLITGPKVSSLIVKDAYIMVPNDKGIPAVQNSENNKKKLLLFISEAKVFCVVKPKN